MLGVYRTTEATHHQEASSLGALLSNSRGEQAERTSSVRWWLMVVDDIVARLTERPCTLRQARRKAADGGVPAEPGMYSWWTITPGALPGVPAQPVTGRTECLLYVGISPKRHTSSQGLRSRACSNHMSGNIGGSTFRQSLAALLWRLEGWQPLWKGDRPHLSRDDNRALSAWQAENLRIGWAVCREPWLYESQVIACLAPPMNLAENKSHPFYMTMSAARAALRQEALRQRGGSL